MTTKTLERKAKKLEKEVGLLRSFVIGQAGKDPEGKYNPDFVQRALKAAHEGPRHEFRDEKSFLKHVRSE
ncbi:MAG: hypothetical protein HYS44_01710 [Candidatus Niyogibacteria bacterium]|nr:hypothetical protein [Candidatus Niyogibacteria bacterium]